MVPLASVSFYPIFLHIANTIATSHHKLCIDSMLVHNKQCFHQAMKINLRNCYSLCFLWKKLGFFVGFSSGFGFGTADAAVTATATITITAAVAAACHTIGGFCIFRMKEILQNSSINPSGILIGCCCCRMHKSKFI